MGMVSQDDVSIENVYYFSLVWYYLWLDNKHDNYGKNKNKNSGKVYSISQTVYNLLLTHVILHVMSDQLDSSSTSELNQYIILLLLFRHQ